MMNLFILSLQAKTLQIQDMQRRYQLLFISLFSFLTPCLAQDKDSTSYNLTFSGTGNLNKTSSGTSYIFNNALRFNIEKEKLEMNSGLNWIYGEDAVKKTNNDFSAFVDMSFLKSKHRFYYWGLANFEKSFSLKIENRLQAGAGLGYNAHDTKTFRLVLTNGILYEVSDLLTPDKYGREHYETLRNSFRIKFRLLIKDRVVIDGSDYIQNSFSDKNDYIIRSNTNVSVKLNKWLSFTTALTYNRLNLTGTENLLFNYGLRLETWF